MRGWLLWGVLLAASTAAALPKPFVITAIDEETKRGVPLVELRTRDAVLFVTDSNGLIAIDDPLLLGQRVEFEIKSHGYTAAEKEVVFEVKAGGRGELKLKRKNIAERLYRITGAGIYEHTRRAGRKAPIEQPMINGGVVGQDTVSTAIYRDRIFWIWGDTTGFLGLNFAVSGATSALPGKGGLDPSIGINFRYFTGREGFSKPMLPLKGGGLVWIEGLLTVREPSSGRERLLATYTRQPGLKPPVECGVALYNDERELFEPWITRPCRGSHVSAHPFKHKDGGIEYWYLYAHERVPNDWAAIQDPKRWETREPVKTASGRNLSCIVWNEYRKRWIGLTEQVGDVNYTEADRPEGPWSAEVKIIEHDQYNFYNVASHAFFNQDGGRVIYLEGTYTESFSGAKQKTPRYDYNQIMYRLRLDDPRLRTATAPALR